MTFRVQESHRNAPGVAKRFTQHPLFLPILFIGFAFGAWKGIMWIVDNAAAEGESSPLQKIMIDRRLETPNDLGQAGRLGNEPRTTASTAPSQPSTERPGEVEVEEVTAVGAGVPEEEVREWRLRGVVYDLATLVPVARCAMVFSDEGSTARLQSSTDSDGRYRVVAPALKNRGYAVALQCKGYALSYLNPGTEGVNRMSAEDRRSLAEDLAKALDPPYAIQAYGGKPLVTDFFVAPLAK